MFVFFLVLSQQLYHGQGQVSFSHFLVSTLFCPLYIIIYIYNYIYIYNILFGSCLLAIILSLSIVCIICILIVKT